MEIFLISDNIVLEIIGSQLYVIQGDKKTPVNPANLERIWVHREIDFPAAVLQELLTQRVELVIQTDGGKPLGFLCPWLHPKGAKGRQAQPLFAWSQEAQNWMAHWLLRKHQAQLYWLSQLDRLPACKEWDKFKALLNIQLAFDPLALLPGVMQEAYMMRLYLRVLDSLLPEQFKFKKRSRQPALDPFNALLNYAYGIFYGMVEGALRRNGLDPYIGFLHEERDGDPALVFDVIEAYRPWADEVCIRLVLEDDLDAKEDFQHLEKGGIWLAGGGKEKLISRLMDFLDAPPRLDGLKSPSRKQQIFADAKALQNRIAVWEPPMLDGFSDPFSNY